MELFHRILKTAVDGGASDVHIKLGTQVVFRISRQLVPIECPLPSEAWINAVVEKIVPRHGRSQLDENREVDFSYFVPGIGRFRTNVFQQRGTYCLAMRYVKTDIPAFEQLGLLPIVRKIAESPRGIVLVAGSTGSGKSTTLAAMMQHINRTSRKHIITLEDPIEYVFDDDQSVIEQREIGLDTPSFPHGLKYVLRQDPDIIMIGEMRDAISFQAAIGAADTGHLVLSTLHTTTASQSVTRILDFFKAEEREQVRRQLVGTLQAVVCQRMVQTVEGGVTVALEVLISNGTVRKLIEENKLDKLAAAIEVGTDDGMQTFNQALFDLQPRTRVVFGSGSVARIGEWAAQLGASRVLLVTDPGLVRAGHAQAVRDHLLSGVRAVELYDRVQENPDTQCVGDCLRVAQAFGPDAIVGLGGGSAMDTAKGCNFLLTNGGRMQDYWGVGKATRAMLPFVAVPTTAGTGSECQSAALISDERTHQKMACLDAKAAALLAILDPALTLSQPPRVTACTGIDALSHALETAVTSRRTPASLMYSREAFRHIVRGFPRVLSHPSDVQARGQMLLGAAFAGAAIESSMLGAAHAAANPLTAHFGIVHGIAVGLMLPHVIRFNAADPAVAAAYAELAVAAGLGADVGSTTSAVDLLVDRVVGLLGAAGMPRSLADAGADPSRIGALASEAARQWTATFNPRPAETADFARLYEAAFETGTASER